MHLFPHVLSSVASPSPAPLSSHLHPCLCMCRPLPSLSLALVVPRPRPLPASLLLLLLSPSPVFSHAHLSMWRLAPSPSPSPVPFARAHSISHLCHLSHTHAVSHPHHLSRPSVVYHPRRLSCAHAICPTPCHLLSVPFCPCTASGLALTLACAVSPTPMLFPSPRPFCLALAPSLVPSVLRPCCFHPRPISCPRPCHLSHAA